jgi:AP2 domain
VTKKPNRAEHRPDGTTIIFIKQRSGETFECLIDSSDYPLVKDYRWHILKVAHLRYAVASVRKPDGKQGAVLLHRIVMPDAELIDHKNRNGLDDRRENLRPATRLQNTGNTRKPTHGKTSKFKGVFWDKGRDKFGACISVENRNVNLGRFSSEEEAALAYNAAAEIRFGSFAVPNQVGLPI